MKFLALLLAIFSPYSLIAQEWRHDAFGAYIGEDAFREEWSGLQERCVDQLICKAETKPHYDIDAIDIYLGQKTVEVGKDIAMSLAILHDKYGNLTTTDEVVTFTLESGAREEQNTIRNGSSFVTFYSHIRAGVFDASAKTQNRQSARQLYQQIPNLESVKPSFNTFSVPLTRGTRFDVMSGDVFDQYNNQMTIGMQATAILKDARGRYVQFPVLSNRTKFSTQIYAEGVDGLAKGSIYVGTTPLGPLGFTVEPLYLLPNAQIRGEYDDVNRILSISITNLRTTQGYLIGDGTEFSLEFVENGERRSLRSTYSLDGQVRTIFVTSTAPFPGYIIAKSKFGQVKLDITRDIIDQSSASMRNTLEKTE